MFFCESNKFGPSAEETNAKAANKLKSTDSARGSSNGLRRSTHLLLAGRWALCAASGPVAFPLGSRGISLKEAQVAFSFQWKTP